MMHIRPAEAADLQACAMLDGSYQTEQIWQMERRLEEPELAAAFHLVTLPRRITVAYPPFELAHLVERWERQGGLGLWVAEWENQFLGFVDVTPLPEQRLGWINHLIVKRRYRRHGVGSGLLYQAMAWAREQGLERMLVVLQSKNHPAIQFCRRFGYQYGGYNEFYYGNQDIALFFGLDLR